MNDQQQLPQPPSPPRAIAVIYHRADWDGIAAGLVIKWWMAYVGRQSDVQMFGMDYGEPLPRLEDEGELIPEVSQATWYSRFEKIFMVDLSVPQLLDDPAAHSRLVWIDHHRSAIEKYEDLHLSGVRLDGVAACRLAWQWGLRQYLIRPEDLQTAFPTLAEFKEPGRLNEPRILRYIGLWDVWDHEDQDTNFVQKGLCTAGLGVGSGVVWGELNANRAAQLRACRKITFTILPCAYDPRTAA